MSARRQIIFYDQRGTGKSPPGTRPTDLTVDATVRDLEALRRKLKLNRIDLLGHSWGGLVSMAYALRYPQHVRNLVLVWSGAPKPAQTSFLSANICPALVATIPASPSPLVQITYKKP